jgi:SAM-dependent methyltransferase
MSRRKGSLPAQYFEGLYASNPDPWKFATSAYEQAKYHATLAALPRSLYQRGLEIGCSIGVFTARLAPRCEQLVAIDISEQALSTARVRCRSIPNVCFEQIAVPAHWPQGTFDLVLLSEVVYYLDIRDVTWLARRLRSSIRTNGHAILVHWTGMTNYPLGGDEAVDLFIESLGPFGLELRRERTPKYRLDTLWFP